MKELNADWPKITPWVPSDISIRNEIGASVDPRDLAGLCDVVDDMVGNPQDWSERIEEVRQRMIANLGHGGEAAGEFLLGEVLRKQEEKKLAAAGGSRSGKRGAVNEA